MEQGEGTQAEQGNIKIRGDILRRERLRLALTQKELGDRIGLSEIRIRKIEKQKVTGIYPPAFRKLGELLKLEIPELRKLIGYSNGHDKSVGDELVDRSNIELGSEVPVPEIPLFDLPLAAGEWMEITDLCEVSEKQLHLQLFRVRLQGDSMKPEYPDRTIVEFRCLRRHLDDVEVGQDYYVQRSDGYATFKRVEKIDEDTITLVAINKKKYPKRLVVARQEVSRVALAVAKVQLV